MQSSSPSISWKLELSQIPLAMGLIVVMISMPINSCQSCIAYFFIFGCYGSVINCAYPQGTNTFVRHWSLFHCCSGCCNFNTEVLILQNSTMFCKQLNCFCSEKMCRSSTLWQALSWAHQQCYYGHRKRLRSFRKRVSYFKCNTSSGAIQWGWMWSRHHSDLSIYYLCLSVD